MISYVLEMLFSDLWTGMAFCRNAGTCPLSDGSQGQVGSLSFLEFFCVNFKFSV